MREYTEKEIAEIREIYERDDEEYGCGYYSLCIDHDCFCSMDAPVQQGFNIELWDRLSKQYQEEIDELRKEMGEYTDDELDDESDWDEDEW